jgi:hypothetical protein
MSYLKFVFGKYQKKSPKDIIVFYRYLVFQPDQIDLYKEKEIYIKTTSYIIILDKTIQTAQYLTDIKQVIISAKAQNHITPNTAR